MVHCSAACAIVYGVRMDVPVSALCCHNIRIVRTGLGSSRRAPAATSYATPSAWILLYRCLQVYISYLEIYNEVGYDLLDPTREVQAMEDLPQVGLQAVPLQQADCWLAVWLLLFTQHLEAQPKVEQSSNRKRVPLGSPESTCIVQQTRQTFPGTTVCCCTGVMQWQHLVHAGTNLECVNCHAVLSRCTYKKMKIKTSTSRTCPCIAQQLRRKHSTW